MFIDFETKSPHDVRKVGGYVYTEDCEPLLLSAAYHKGPVKVFEGDDIMRLCEKLRGQQVIGWGSFDSLVLRSLGIEHRYVDASILAAEYGWPLKLEIAAKAAGLSVGKDPKGRRLIKLFQTADPADYPEEWEHFRDYCRQDTAVMRAIVMRCPRLSEHEERLRQLDRRINNRGVQVDTAAVQTLAALRDATMAQVNAHLARVTGGAITGTSQVAKLTEFTGLDNMKAPTVEEALRSLPPGPQRDAVLCRQIGSKSSGAKLDAFQATVSADGRARGMLQFCGAHTRRWAGRGIQPQNFPRGCLTTEQFHTLLQVAPEGPGAVQRALHMAPTEAISGALRGCLTAAPGHSLLVADYSAIEARVLVWLAGQDDVLETYRQGRDVYKRMAAAVYFTPQEEITPEQRFMGKTLVLGCGYMMGWERLQQALAAVGITVDEEEARRLIAVFRGNYWAVENLWTRIRDAVFEATSSKRILGYRRSRTEEPLLYFWVEDGVLRIRLPGGSTLHYHEPRIEMVPAPWDADQLIRAVTAMSRSTTGQWVRRALSPGLVTENAVQSIAREIMGDGMLRVDDDFPLVLTVHDELIAEVPEERADLAEFERRLSIPPEWAPDLPLAVEGQVMKRYGK